MSLINGYSIDPAPLFNANELGLACRRYQVEDARGEGEDDFGYYNRLLEVRGPGRVAMTTPPQHCVCSPDGEQCVCCCSFLRGITECTVGLFPYATGVRVAW